MNPELLEKLKILKEEFPELENKNISFLDKEPKFLTGDQFKFCGNNSLDFLDIISGPTTKIQVRKSGIHGYGVFAKESILQEEQIEEARLLRLNLRSKYQFDKVLNDHIFSLSKCDCGECKKHGQKQYIGLGYSSLYNHSEQANAEFSIDFENDIIRIKALKEVSPGEEIFFNYGKEYWLMRKIWHGLQFNV